MPMSAPKPCSAPGCRTFALANGSRCELHKKQLWKDQDARRGTAHQRGYTSAWRKAREAFLRHHPLCKLCEAEGLTKAALIVDHVVPHKGDKALFWESSNWQPLCKPCHDRKTATEDGGWGRGIPT